MDQAIAVSQDKTKLLASSERTSPKSRVSNKPMIPNTDHRPNSSSKKQIHLSKIKSFSENEVICQHPLADFNEHLDAISEIQESNLSTKLSETLTVTYMRIERRLLMIARSIGGLALICSTFLIFIIPILALILDINQHYSVLRDSRISQLTEVTHKMVEKQCKESYIHQNNFLYCKQLEEKEKELQFNSPIFQLAVAKAYQTAQEEYMPSNLLQLCKFYIGIPVLFAAVCLLYLICSFFLNQKWPRILTKSASKS